MEKMQKYKNKTIAIAITLLLTLLNNSSNYHTKSKPAKYPGTTIPTWAYLQVVPRPNWSWTKRSVGHVDRQTSANGKRHLW